MLREWWRRCCHRRCRHILGWGGVIFWE
jgi:hypothetical protein